MTQASVRPAMNTQIQLIGMPQGKLSAEHFRQVDVPMPACASDEVLVQVKVISLDAANRAWMQGATYRSALEAGQVMAGGAIAEVLESRAPGFAPGDLVFGDIGWQRFASLPAAQLRKLPRMEPVTHLLSVYGIAGLTAYFGLLRVGQPQPGQTVVVSAAAGSVGSLVGQIARIRGCRVIGIAGGQAKCDWLVKTLGFDAAIDYKAGGLSRALKEAAPEGIDVYFDNVGGDVFEACLFRMKQGGRIACCGAVSQYDGEAPRHGPRGVPGLIVTKRLTLQGFVLYDFYPEIDTAMKDLQAWVTSGQLKVIEDVRHGLEQVPQALIGLLAGDNYGKRMVVV
jgi:NADPH-dependent curcumin reductase CurA